MASAPRMYELVQTIRFESARRLPKVPDGHPCKNVYGLAFYLDIHVEGALNPETGWVFDFADIDRAVSPLRAIVDHHYLNDVEGLDNPTSEVLVAWFWDRLKPALPGLKELSLRENDVSRIIFRGLARRFPRSSESLVMYRATTGIHLQFAHHVRGHRGPCISLHGHTWRFDITLEAKELDVEGFVVDFDLVHERLLQPIFSLLDHSLALGEASYAETKELIAPLGTALVASRKTTLGHLGEPPAILAGELGGARNERPGGIKLAVFPFTPTSERLAEWLYRVASSQFEDARVKVARARIYESLHPDESVADYVP